MGKLEIYGLYATAFVVFLFAWREAKSAMRSAREQKNERQMDVARGDRNFAVFAGLYIALVVFLAARFTPKNAKLGDQKPGPAKGKIGKGKAAQDFKVKALIFRKGQIILVDEKGKEHPVKDEARIDLPGVATEDRR